MSAHASPSPNASGPARPRLSFAQIVNMNVGFLGIQYSFGLQQGNMSPIYRYLGADDGLLWVLDAANNVTMEPYRAFVSDRLDESQHPTGFLTQSVFTGRGQTLSYLTPSILVLLGMSRDRTHAHGIPFITVGAFLIGALFSIT
jgi:hypothetical protein